MDDVEIPEFFICPISLQIMKDPVTTITGITYDRESIEHWLLIGKNTICPVSKQPLPIYSDLTPNHTLRRLIQAWCIGHGVDRIPTPKQSLNKTHVLKLIKNLSLPKLQLRTLKQLEFLAVEKEVNRKYMVEAGIGDAVVSFVVTRFNLARSMDEAPASAGYKDKKVDGLEEALSILQLVHIPKDKMPQLVIENDQIIESLTWVLGFDKVDGVDLVAVKTHAVLLLRRIMETASSNLLERLKPDFFERIVGVLRNGDRISHQGIHAALQVMLEAFPWGRNRQMIVEAGAVFELIEIELGSPEKRTTELVLGLLSNLCCCAEGRAQLVSHAGGIAVVSKRMIGVSPTAGDLALVILSLISKYYGTNIMILEEMLRVGAVSKLCMVLKLERYATCLKDKAGEILTTHIHIWKKSPCFDVSCLKRLRDTNR